MGSFETTSFPEDSFPVVRPEHDVVDGEIVDLDDKTRAELKSLIDSAQDDIEEAEIVDVSDSTPAWGAGRVFSDAEVEGIEEELVDEVENQIWYRKIYQNFQEWPSKIKYGITAATLFALGAIVAASMLNEDEGPRFNLRSNAGGVVVGIHSCQFVKTSVDQVIDEGSTNVEHFLSENPEFFPKFDVVARQLRAAEALTSLRPIAESFFGVQQRLIPVLTEKYPNYSETETRVFDIVDCREEGQN